MEVVAGLELAGRIFSETLGFISEAKRMKLAKKHEELLQNVAKAKSQVYPDYSNAKIQLAERDLRIFYEAYPAEVRAELIARQNSGGSAQ